MRGSNAFLQQARRNNWQRYLESLDGAYGEQRAARPSTRAAGWDICILTASDDDQASMMRRQLEWRRAQGLLPKKTQFFVVADPGGRRIGSGGATLRILAALYAPEAQTAQHDETADLFALTQNGAAHHRVLVIHSGGDSRRLPHCSAVGKLFARIPHILPDGRASTIFDEMLINLSGVAASAPPGVLVLSGDVLLVFDHLQLSFQRHGVTGVSIAAPEALGLRHGVYVTTPEHRTVTAFLHKSSPETLARWQAVDADGNVQIDTGLVWFDSSTAKQVAALTAEPSVAALMDVSAQAAGINLYGDLLLPLAESTERQAYLDDESDGPATPALRIAREKIWSRLRGVHFMVERLQPAVFVHFGSSEEYWRMVTSDAALAHLCGWSRHAAAWTDAADLSQGDDLVLINAVVEAAPNESNGGDSPSHSGQPALVTDSQITALTWQGQAIVAGLRTQQALRLQRDVILHQLPVADGFVTRVLGLGDDPKLLWTAPRASFLNRPWAEWLAEAGIPVEALWPHVPADQQNLWHARLFPCVDDRETSLEVALPLQQPAEAPDGWRDRWQNTPRLSLAEGFAQADGQRILDDLAEIEDSVAARQAADAIRQELPAEEVARALGAVEVHAMERRCRLLGSWLTGADATVQWRGLTALTAASGDSRYEDTAFARLAHVIEADVVHRQQQASWSSFRTGSASDNASARVEAAARIDFIGGWTDTPPYSIERGGMVLNAAVTLRGRRPIVAESSWLPEPEIVLESRDIDEVLRPQQAGDVLNYRNPADPFALVKAALVLKGIVPEDAPPQMRLSDLLSDMPGGIRLVTQTSIPRGSGLGTSSIMAGAVLASLDRLVRNRTEQAQLFDQVLCLEQMMTTGGGWQDQVGGLVGGVKLVTSLHGLPQQIKVEPIADDLLTPLRQRLFLVYTGQQRLAKNLLRAVMGRWMARDPEMVWILGEIGRLALAMENSLQCGDIDEFGVLVGEHWRLNKRMDPGCTNPFIDELFGFLAPYMVGGKLAGAGGGGFAIIVARNGVVLEDLDAALSQRYAGAPVGVWPSGIAEEGLAYT